MAVAEFLNNFRVASVFLRAWDCADEPPTPEQLADAKKYAALWLTPDALKGFDSSGFYSLTADQGREIEAHAEQFRWVASRIPPDGEPSDEQVRVGREHFLAVYRVVGKYLFHETSRKVIRALEQVLAEEWVPDFVVRYDFRVGDDSTGDPAVWVWIIVTDESAEKDQYFDSFDPLREAIDRALQAHGVNRWVYLTFRSLSEQREFYSGDLE